MYEARLFPELEYTFKHALTHEVAYGSMLQERRQALHRKVLEAIERLHADRLGEHVELLAHHALRGQVRDMAVKYLRQAGDRALARSANREASTLFEQALGVLAEHAPNQLAGSLNANERVVEVDGSAPGPHPGASVMRAIMW